MNAPRGYPSSDRTVDQLANPPSGRPAHGGSMTPNEQHLRHACYALYLSTDLTPGLMDDVDACMTLVRHERLTASRCDHVSTSRLSDGPPTFAPVLTAEGEPVTFCLDCHTILGEEARA